MPGLSGKTAFISGASRGIGEAAAHALAKAGAKVALAARSTAAIEAIAARLGDAAMAVPCDVADYASVEAAVARAEATLGPIDIMVSNAGIVDPIEHIATGDPAGWGNVIDINVKGAYHTARAVLPGMTARKSGTIITIGSGAAHGPMEGWSHYCASKAAALMLTRAIDKECSESGVVSINLSPGTVATDMQRAIGKSGLNPVSQMKFEDHKPASAVGEAIALLAGPEGKAHAGAEVRITDLPITW